MPGSPFLFLQWILITHWQVLLIPKWLTQRWPLPPRSLPSNLGQTHAATQKLQRMHLLRVLSPQASIPSSVLCSTDGRCVLGELGHAVQSHKEHHLQCVEAWLSSTQSQNVISSPTCSTLKDIITLPAWFLGFFHLWSSLGCLYFICWLHTGGVLWQMCLYVPVIWEAEAGGCLSQRHGPYWVSIAKLWYFKSKRTG